MAHLCISIIALLTCMVTVNGQNAGRTTDCANDIVFVVDSSASIHPDDFNLMKNFLVRLVGRLRINSRSTRVGLVVYSQYVDNEKSFNLEKYSTVAGVQSAIRALRHLASSTNTADALAYVRTTILTSAAGARSNMPNIVVVFTDGKSNYPVSTLAEAEKLKRIRAGGSPTKLVALGIGHKVDQAELRNISSPPHRTNVILVTDYASLPTVEDQLRDASCLVDVTTSTSVTPTSSTTPPSTTQWKDPPRPDSCVNVYPKGWVYLRSARKYYRAIFELVDWDKAVLRCRELGTYSRLVDINDRTENDAVKHFIRSFDERLSRICEGPKIFGMAGYQGYWTSGQRTNPASCATPWVWKTYDGSYKNVSYTDWHGSQPNCANGKETCLQLTTTKYLNESWTDINCEWVLCPLCELDV